MTFGSGVFGSGLFGGALSSGLTGVTYTIEMAFGDSYSTPAASRTWTDVTAYVSEGHPVVIGFARGDEFSTADANSLSLTLNNTDGRFSPGNTSGAYYPDVRVGVPVRVTSTAGGVDHRRFVGYVEEWPLEWPGGSDDYAVSRVTARSRMARLGTSAALGNLIYEECRRDSPVVHYMLNNKADAGGGESLTVTRVGGGGGTVNFSTATGPGTDGLTALSVTHGAGLGDGRVLQVPLSGFTDPRNFTLEVFYSTNGSDDGGDLVSVYQAGYRSVFEVPDVDGHGSLNLMVTSASPANTLQGVWGGSPNPDYVIIEQDVSGGVDDGAIHHCALTGDGTTLALYYDGTAQAATDTIPAGTWTPGSLWVAGSPENIRVGEGIYAHAVLFTTALAAARIADHAQAGDDGFAGETPAARLARYAAYAGIPAAEHSFDTNADTPMAHIDTTGSTPLDLMRKVEQTDGGVLHDAPDGTLTYTARSGRYNAPIVLTIPVDQVEIGVSPRMDRSALTNEVRATVADGSSPQETVRAVAQSSYDDYGPHTRDLELATTDADEAHAAAWWRVNTYGEPRPRIPSLRVSLGVMPSADVATLLGLTIGDRIEIEDWPSQAGTAFADGFFVEGYTETIGVGFHHIEFNVSPATGFDVWTIEDPVYGQYDAYPIAY